MSDASRAADLANLLRAMPSIPIVVRGGMCDSELSRFRTALLLADMGPAVRLRAMMEDWTWEKIVMECY